MGSCGERICEKGTNPRPLFGPYPICPCGEHGHVCVMWSLVCLVRVSVFNHTHFRFSYGFHLSSLPPSFVRFGCFLRGPVPVTPSLVRLLPMHFLSRTHDMSVRAPPSDNPSVRAHFFFFFVFPFQTFRFRMSFLCQTNSVPFSLTCTSVRCACVFFPVHCAYARVLLAMGSPNGVCVSCLCVSFFALPRDTRPSFWFGLCFLLYMQCIVQNISKTKKQIKIT